jgi:hypothetical protein
MEIICLPRLSQEQEANLPEGYVRPPVEGMCVTDGGHAEALVFIYVGYCDWETDFEYCVKEFTLTVFHELMHVLVPGIDDYVPYAEKVLADLLCT